MPAVYEALPQNLLKSFIDLSGLCDQRSLLTSLVMVLTTGIHWSSKSQIPSRCLVPSWFDAGRRPAGRWNL